MSKKFVGENILVKKIIYYLLSLDELPTKKCLSKNLWINEQQALPSCFIKITKKFFKKNKKKSSVLEKTDPISSWKNFCLKSSYQEVLTVILMGILKYPIKKASWVLNTPIETLSYQLDHGLLSLGEDIEKSKKQTPHLKKTTDIKQQALVYCDWLLEQKLPEGIQQLKINHSRKKIHYLLWFFITIFVLALVLKMLSSILVSSNEIILYQSFKECFSSIAYDT